MHTIKTPISLLFTFLWITIPGFLSAQSTLEQVGRLPITTYSPEEYRGDPEVYTAIQSEEGLMYFGTASGMHEYDGVSWRSLYKRNQLAGIYRFTKDAKGRIFYTGIDFGYLEVDQNGETRPVSLLHLLPEEFSSDFYAWEVHSYNGYIFLRTVKHHLIKLELEEDLTLKSFKSWQAETRFGISYLVNNEIYVQQAEKGLYKLEEEGLKLIPNTERLGIEYLMVMLPYSENKSESLLLGTIGAGFYLLEEGVLTKFPTEIDQVIKDGYALNSAIAYQGNYILRFYGAGLVIMNPKGEILKRIGTAEGLPSDIVRDIYLDQNEGLWALTDDGIARITIDSPILSFGKELGISSVVQKIHKSGKDLFLGTSTALVKFDPKGRSFRPNLKEGNFSTIDFLVDGEDLIVIHARSPQVHRNGKAIRLEGLNPGERATSVLIPKNNPNLLFVGTESGLLAYERGLSNDFPWEYQGRVSSVEHGVGDLREGNNGTLYTIGIYGLGAKIYALNLEDRKLESNDPTRIKANDIPVGLEDRTLMVNGEFYWFSNQRTLKYLPKEGQLVPTDDFKAVEKDFYEMIELKSGQVWYESLNGKKFALKRDAEGKFTIDETPNAVAPYISEVNFLDDDGIQWFGSQKNLIRYDPKKDNQTDKQFFTLIRRIETKTDTLPLPQYGRKEVTSPLESKENSYRFEFAAPYFDEEKKTEYQTFLEGFNSDWVDWTDNKFKEYTNLPAGTYTFRVRAMAHTGRISEEASYSFVVLPPWYSTWWAYILYVLILGGLITAIVKWRSRKLKAQNRILEERVNERTAELENSLTELKSAQTQLIQSEKMASLGELTAGIAHEIQNPLNFVNNFSELNRELVQEVNEELDKGDLEEVKAILKDLESNSDKINHHGKRAEAIVKGMLAHSRTNSGEKTETDLNILADEYLRLAYHGLRAKEKSFNVDFQTDFDSNLPKVRVISQDISRVLLNLINNAFYAVNEERIKLLENGDKAYKPMVKVKTQNLGKSIMISVSDNGGGIPDSVKSKIFQPFFTTKPTGQGTGLGLSLSYDIVKAHGGEISVESEKARPDDPVGRGIGTTFIITLPI